MFRNSWVEINLSALKHNFQEIKKYSDKEIICVIKANGYGSGDQFIISAALQSGISMFAVSSLDEAIILRNEGCTSKILILGYVNPKDIEYCIQYDVSTTIVSLDWLQEILNYPHQNLKLHLKVDTGMNRIGIKKISECKEALSICLNNGLMPEGIFTHFACSDVENQETTLRQYNLFKNIVDELNYPFHYVHCDNSDAILSFHDKCTNAVRLGIAMFGISAYKNNLHPVFSLYSTISNIKTVDVGETISYGATYRTTQNEIIATLPIGYADGWLRKNQGRQVWIDGEYAEIVGRICMDQCMIHLQTAKPVETRVELFGKHISVQSVAHDLETIPYEILTGLSERLTRIYIENNEIISENNARLELSLHTR